MKQGPILYAPNVHTGGGWVLLRSLLAAAPQGMAVFLDERVRNRLNLSENLKISWVLPTPGSRLKAEFLLRKAAGAEGTVLCFHSLPPLLPAKCKIVVFFQNANILDFDGLTGGWFVRARLIFEHIIFKAFKHRVDRFYVQTPTMRQLLVEKGEIADDNITVFPFDEQKKTTVPDCDEGREGFVYVADGVSHKNHHVLIAAWSLLAEQEHYPTLKLTLGERDQALWLNLKQLIDERQLKVKNVGHLTFSQMEKLYQSAEALIFPSLKESFGLPLIEAGRYGLPVIASERDYVRDVCCPVETFDPLSPRSVARAVSRFKGWERGGVKISEPKEFLQQAFCD